MIITRRSWLRGMLAAPIIVAAPSLMKVRPIDAFGLTQAIEITPILYALSDASLRAAFAEVEQFRRQLNLTIALHPRMLIVPRELQSYAERVLVC